MTPRSPPLSREVSVVIPRTGAPVLRGCLESIRAGSRWPARVVIVDQGPGTAESSIAAMRQDGLDVVHIRAQRTGISAATNFGLRQVATAYGAVTHDDCLVRRDSLERLERRLLEESDAVMTGRVQPEGEGIVLTIKVADIPAVYTSPLLTGDVLFPPNMAFPLQVMAVPAGSTSTLRSPAPARTTSGPTARCAPACGSSMTPP
jgi:hypothetical protein